MLLREAAYDTDGSLLLESDALGGATNHAQTLKGLGQTVITYTVGGTRITTPAGRLATRTWARGVITPYSYLANSSLVGQIASTNSATAQMTTTKQYDALNRLTSISSVPSVSLAAPQRGGGGSVVSSSYQYNLARQRTAATNADGSYWLYGYDPIGQVTAGKKYWSDNSVVAGEQFQYGFDTIGNRTSRPSWPTPN